MEQAYGCFLAVRRIYLGHGGRRINDSFGVDFAGRTDVVQLPKPVKITQSTSMTYCARPDGARGEVGVSSGTAALACALVAVGVGPGATRCLCPR
ncbi:MAG: hypothetical protein JOZ95_21085 [Solirubrobacterales bacterium]|nr:hypothetical protein [Solirubrobacterales bacterium]